MPLADPYAFTSEAEMGDPAEPDCPVPMDLWRRCLDPVTRQPTGYLKRERYLTIAEVFKNLSTHLDLTICRKCGFERPRRRDDCCSPCDRCAAETECLIDEYFSAVGNQDQKRRPCGPFWRVMVWAVTGANEGHYYHVGTISDRPECRYTDLFIGKTWRGMDGAVDMVARINRLLGV